MEKIVKDVCGAFIEKDGLILMAQRKEKDSFSLKWEFPGGSVEDGELRETCIVREIKEELGMEVECGRLLGTFEDEIPTLKIIIYLYECRIVAGSPKALDVRDFKWIKLKEAGKLDLAPADRKILEYLQRNYGKN